MISKRQVPDITILLFAKHNYDGNLLIHVEERPAFVNGKMNGNSCMAVSPGDSLGNILSVQKEEGKA